MTIPPEVSADVVFAELSAVDAAFLRDHASRRLSSLVPGGPMATTWQRIIDALDAALPPKGTA